MQAVGSAVRVYFNIHENGILNSGCQGGDRLLCDYCGL